VTEANGYEQLAYLGQLNISELMVVMIMPQGSYRSGKTGKRVGEFVWSGKGQEKYYF